MAKKGRKPDSADPTGDATAKPDKTASKPPRRRGLLVKTVTAGILLCALGTPLGAVGRMLISPLSQTSPPVLFHPLTTEDNVTETPRQFDLFEDRQDAWIRYAGQKVGSVFLRRKGDRILAFQASCPSGGCTIRLDAETNPHSGAEELLFFCPCHGARFDLEGKRLDTVAPRDMDTLEVRVHGLVFVEFTRFRYGIAEKVPMP